MTPSLRAHYEKELRFRPGERGDKALAELRAQGFDEFFQPLDSGGPAYAEPAQTERPAAVLSAPHVSTRAPVPYVAPESDFGALVEPKAVEAAPPDELPPALPDEPLWRPDVVSPGNHHEAADSFRADGHGTLIFYRGNFWQQDVEGNYEHITRRRIEFQVSEHLREGVRAPGNRTFKVNRGVVREVMAALEQRCAAPTEQRAPFWRKPRLAVLPPDLWPPTECIALRNCILHAPTGETMPPDMRFFTRNTLQFNYEPDAVASIWNQCLGEWFPDPNDVLRLQEIFGYLLLPRTNLQKFFIFLGTGRNGKGVVVRVLYEMLGRFNAVSIDMKKLTSEKTRALFVDALLAVIAEFSFTRLSDRLTVTNFFKTVTGEDNHGQYSARLLVEANRLPAFLDDSPAFGERAEILFFPRFFTEDERDPELKDKLMHELPGVFNWALAGLRRLTAAGKFTESKSSNEMRRRIVRAAGGVSAFINEEYELDPKGFVTHDDLIAAYSDWNGPPMGSNELLEAVALVSDGIKAARPWGDGKHRPRGFLGLKLRGEQS